MLSNCPHPDNLHTFVYLFKQVLVPAWYSAAHLWTQSFFSSDYILCRNEFSGKGQVALCPVARASILFCLHIPGMCLHQPGQLLSRFAANCKLKHLGLHSTLDLHSMKRFGLYGWRTAVADCMQVFAQQSGSELLWTAAFPEPWSLQSNPAKKTLLCSIALCIPPFHLCFLHRFKTKTEKCSNVPRYITCLVIN